GWNKHGGPKPGAATGPHGCDPGAAPFPGRWVTTMSNLPRQLVICCDGTNNTLTGGIEDTNVLRLYEHLRLHAPTDNAPFERLLYYDPGVGNPDTVPPTGLTDW